MRRRSGTIRIASSSRPSSTSKAGKFESAGTIYAQKEEWAKAAECYVKANSKSVAAEMYEKAGDHKHAAECYREVDFLRHAAQAYVKCKSWLLAAAVPRRAASPRKATKMHGDAAKEAEIRKLVLNAGKLYQRSREPEKALSILERGELQCRGR